MVFADDGAVLAQVQKPFGQHFPADGWVEHDADEIFATTVACAREALAAAKLAAKDVAGIGIAVQRETVVVWDRATGKPVQRAIVWQDRRTAERCRVLAERSRRRGAGRPHRAAARSVFLGHQARLDPRRGAGRARCAPRRASCSPARSTRGCSGSSPAAASTPPTRRTRRARCCSTSTSSSGTRSCARCSTCRRRSCPPCATAPTISAARPPTCSARRSSCARWSATSRPARSARTASRRARPRRRTAPDASCSSTPATRRACRATACSARSRSASPAW